MAFLGLVLGLTVLVGGGFLLGLMVGRRSSSVSMYAEDMRQISDHLHSTLVEIEKLTREALMIDPTNPFAVQVDDELRKFKQDPGGLTGGSK